MKKETLPLEPKHSSNQQRLKIVIRRRTLTPQTTEHINTFDRSSVANCYQRYRVDHFEQTNYISLNPEHSRIF